jgi:hypothetical protein
MDQDGNAWVTSCKNPSEDSLTAKGLNGLLDPTTRPRLVQVYPPASDACCPPCATCDPR